MGGPPSPAETTQESDVTEDICLSDDGFVLDEWDQEWGTCNACGAEVRPYDECCDDGEVVPYA
jgi:hypothetical protein